ncbi:MAG: hypothetical protein EON96_21115 [Caulobacteraceae bacterium]|nr:MAG: hypothetical protein EON96_21115 [Caulobacteraceae bacterium]
MLAAFVTALALFQTAPDEAVGCALTPEHLVANRTLSFESFDQAGVTPWTARKLGERGCNAEAARASEDYLLQGPELTERQRQVVSWHLGQYLAESGEERAAARVMATTMRREEMTPDNFDWNTYVLGTHAFLTKDRAAMDAAVTRLSRQEGVRNQINARALRRLQSCFDKPYTEAYACPAN